jgi:hypothetical protein
MDETRMILPDDETSKVTIPKEGDPIPPVDREDLRRNWKIWRSLTCESSREAKSQAVNLFAVTRRNGMIRMLANFLFDAPQIANRAPS